MNFLKSITNTSLEHKILGSSIFLGSIFLIKALFKKRPSNSLNGKKDLGIVITGGSEGIGFHFAREFLKRNHKVLVCSRSEEKLKEAKELIKNEFKKESENFHTFVCDVSKESDVIKFTEHASKIFKNIDVWINNAGVPSGNMQSLEDIETKEIDNCIKTNILGAVYCSKHALRILKAQNFGHLFELEGFGSHNNFRHGLTIYGMTKCANSYLAQSLAVENQNTNVGVHRIYPGLTLTSFITKGKSKVPPIMANMLNIIGDLPENVAKYLVPKILTIEGSNKRLEYIAQWQYALKFLTSVFYKKNKFYDSEGNWISKDKKQ